MIHQRLAIATAIVIVGISGCHRPATNSSPSRISAGPSAKPSSAPVVTPGKPRSAKDDLQVLGECLYEYALKAGRPAASINDIGADLTRLDPGLAVEVMDGTYVIRWGIDPRTNDDPILAYEKEVPTKGGWVLWDHSVITRETAKDFQTALSQRKK